MERADTIVTYEEMALAKGTKDATSVLAEVFSARSPSYEHVTVLLQEANRYALANAGVPFRLSLVLHHIAFLLQEGTTLFAVCTQAIDSGQALTLERVFRDQDNIRKLVVTLARSPVRPTHDAFHEYIEGPSISIALNPVTVDFSDVATHFGNRIATLGQSRLAALYRDKQTHYDRLRKAALQHGATMRLMLDRIVKQDKLLVLRAYTALLSVAKAPPREFDRSAHPYRRPVLHILPRLLRPPHGESVLSFLATKMAELATRGFGGLMLTPVDKQSVSAYFQEYPDGTVRGYANNHGYWSSGEVGIDPDLGDEGDYIRLVEVARRYGLTFVQDCTFCTLGYPPQLPDLAASTALAPSVTLSRTETAVFAWDTRAFLHATEMTVDGTPHAGSSPTEYADAVSRLHVAAAHGLPRPNLHDAEVLKSVLGRSDWLIKAARVQAFRVDMAKHIGLGPLREIIEHLRISVCREGAPSDEASSERFSAVLEYWTMEYRDLGFIQQALSDVDEGVYFYDFPLAKMLHEIVRTKCNIAESVSNLLTERRNWRINVNQLIPTFIDHDNIFKPIYDGTFESASLVVFGYALAAMLSANGPAVYLGFQDDGLACRGDGDGCVDDERSSRKPTHTLFHTRKLSNPSVGLAQLFRALDERDFFARAYDQQTAIENGGDWLRISRCYWDAIEKSERILVGYFDRNGTHDIRIAAHESLVFHHLGASKVILTSVPLHKAAPHKANGHEMVS
jgi:hypothetical protein